MDTIKNQKRRSQPFIRILLISLMLIGILAFRNVPKTYQDEPERGTFTADSLVWSGNNNKMYLKGIMQVQFGKTKMKGTGSYSFLGEVHLLVVNDKRVPHDAPINLSGRKCELLKLTPQQGVEKFGNAGDRGAVVVTFLH